MAQNKTVKKKYIRPHLYKSKTRTKPKLYKNRSNKKNRSRFRGGKTMKGGMDPQVVSSTGFVFDPTSKYRKPGRFYGTKYKQLFSQDFTMYPEDYVIMEKKTKQNKKFFSPYNLVETHKWTNQKSNVGTDTNESKKYVEEIKRLDEESRKLLEEKLLSSESSSAVQEKEIDKIKEEINEKNITKNKIITDLQIHRLKEGYGKSAIILHQYVIQCIIRLKYPRFRYDHWHTKFFEKQFDINEMTISDEETNALEFIKENINKEYYRKNALFEEIKDMPIIPTDFAWLLDKRIITGGKYPNKMMQVERNYNLFGEGGIFEKIENDKKRTINIPSTDNKALINKDKIFLKIWTANVIAKYIFKIYHEVEYSHIYGEIYPTIGEIMPEEEKEKIKKIEDAAKEATAQKTASPAQRPAPHPTEQTLDNNSSTP